MDLSHQVGLHSLATAEVKHVSYIGLTQKTNGHLRRRGMHLPLSLCNPAKPELTASNSVLLPPFVESRRPFRLPSDP
jgi:hypothetical protein